MKTDVERRQTVHKVYAAVITALLVGTTAGLFIYHDHAGKMRSAMDGERIKNESLYAEKLTLEKEIAQMRGALLKANAMNIEVSDKYEHTMQDLRAKNKAIEGMKSDQAKAKQLLWEVQTLRTARDEWQAEVASYQQRIESLTRENSRWREDHAAMATTVERLESELASLSQVAVNNSLVEASKNNANRLTVRAGKTKRVKVGFDLPEEMIGNLYFEMTTPEGKKLNSHQSMITVVESEQEAELIASVDPVLSREVRKKHIEMVYEPVEKLESGIYKIDVFSGEKYVGTTRIHLR